MPRFYGRIVNTEMGIVPTDMSRKLITIGIAVTVAVSFMFVGFGGVAAHDGETDVGASGNCSDDSGNGGGGSVGVSSDGSVDDTDADEVQSTAEGLAWFAQQRQETDDDPCDHHESDENNSYDYIEVHAGDGENGVQYCYSEDNSADNGNVDTEGGDACHA